MSDPVRLQRFLRTDPRDVGSDEAMARVVAVAVGGQVIAETRAVLTLEEASYPPALHIPPSDVDQSPFARFAAASYCPDTGEASYYSIPLGEAKAVDAVWEYQDPYAPVAETKGHVAFHPSRVDSIDIEAGSGQAKPGGTSGVRAPGLSRSP